MRLGLNFFTKNIVAQQFLSKSVYIACFACITQVYE